MLLTNISLAYISFVKSVAICLTLCYDMYVKLHYYVRACTYAVFEGICMYDIQRASISKRISAFLLDIIVFSIAAVGFILLITSITGYDAQVEKYEAHYIRYAEEYGIDRDITEEEFQALSAEEQQRYKDVEEMFKKDEAVFRDYQLLINLTLISVSIGLFLAFMLLEFAIPLFFGNGQTLGKKVFAIGVV